VEFTQIFQGKDDDVIFDIYEKDRDRGGMMVGWQIQKSEYCRKKWVESLFCWCMYDDI